MPVTEDKRQRLLNSTWGTRSAEDPGTVTQTTQPTASSLSDGKEQLRNSAWMAPMREQPAPAEKDEGWQSSGALQDIGVGLAAGVARIPSTIAGVGDWGFGLTAGALEAGSRAIGDDEWGDRYRRMANARPWSTTFEAVGDATGFSPSEWGDQLREERYSPQMLEQSENVDAAWDQAESQWEEGNRLGAVGSVVGSYLKNPRTIQSLVTEAIPETLLSGALTKGISALAGTRAVSGTGTKLTPSTAGRAAQAPRVATPAKKLQAAERTSKLSPTIAVGLGQAPLAVGQTMSDIEDDAEYDRAVAAATAAGLGGMLFGAGSAKFAEHVGLVDPELAISRIGREVGSSTPSKRALPLRMAGGAISEGVLQEMPQESIQQMSINWAENNPLFENVPRSAVEGFLAGGVLGAGTNIVRAGGSTPTNLTDSNTAPDTSPSTGTETPDAEGPDVPTLLGEYRGLNTVVNNITDSEQMNTALERMQALKTKLENAGIPESALTEELARNRYQELKLREYASTMKARQVAAKDPAKAQQIMAKLPAMQAEIATLENTYGSDRLTSPGLQASLELRALDGTNDYFKQDGRLNKRAESYLNDLLTTDPQDLKAALVESEVRNRRQDRWRPLENYALRKLGIDPESIEAEANAYGEASPAQAPTTQAPPSVQPGSSTPTNLMAFTKSKFANSGVGEVTQAEPQQRPVFNWDAEDSFIDYFTAQFAWDQAGLDRTWDSLSEAEQAFVGSRLRDLEQMAAEPDSQITSDDLLRTVKSADLSLQLASRADFTPREQELIRALMSIDMRTVDTDAVMQRVGEYMGVSRQQASKDLTRLLKKTRSDGATPKQFLNDFFGVAPDVQEGAETLVASTTESEEGGELGGDLSVITSAGQSQTGSGPRADAQALISQITDLPDAVGEQFLAENAELINRAQQDTADGRKATKELRAKVKSAIRAHKASRDIESRLANLPPDEADAIRKEHADRIRIADPEGNAASKAAYKTVQSAITRAENKAKQDALLEEDRELAQENMARALKAQREWLESPYGATVDAIWDQIVAPNGVLPTGPENLSDIDPQSAAVIISRVAEALGPQLESIRSNEALMAAALRAADTAIREIGTSDVLFIKDKDGVTHVPATTEQLQQGADGESQRALPYGDVSSSTSVYPAEPGGGEGSAPVSSQPAITTRRRRTVVKPEQDDTPDRDTDAGLGAESTQETTSRQNTEALIQALRTAEQSPTGDVQQVFSVVRSVASPEMRIILDKLVDHPSLRGLRFSTRDTANLDRTRAAYGTYDPAVHAVWMNIRKFSAAADPNNPYTINRSGTPDQAMVETFIHEVIHAVTRDAIAQAENTGSSLDVQIQGIQDDIAEWMLLNDTSKLSERTVSALNNMMSNAKEVVTYGMTSPEVQDVLRQIRSSQSNSSLWDRFVDALRSLLNLPSEYRSVLEDVLRATDQAMDQNPQAQQAVVQRWRKELAGLRNAKTPREIAEQSIAFVHLAVDNIDKQILSDRLAALIEAHDDASDLDRSEIESQMLDESGRVIRLIARERRALNSGRKDVSAFDEIAHDYRESVYNRMYASAPPKLKNAMRSTKNSIKRAGLATMFSSDIADLVYEYLPQARKYFDSINRRIAYRNKLHVEIQKVAEPVASWSQDRRDAFNSFLMESTYAEAWGFEPDWLPEAKVDPEMAAKFNELLPQEQEVAISMFRLAHQMHKQTQDTIRANIQEVYAELLEKTRSPQKQVELERERDRELASHDRKQAQFRNAYLPLKRWGEWAVVYKSDAFREAERSKDRKKIDELKANPDHYQVHFTESEYEALNLRDALKKQGINADQPFPRMRYDEQNELIPYDFLQRLREQTMSAAETSKQGAAIWNAVEKLYVQSLSETASRKSELRRMKIYGADHDMTRAFIEHGMSLAALQSSLEINKDTRKVLQEMKDAATDPNAPASTRPDRMMALNEVLARHALSLDYDPKPWERKIMSGTSIWILLSSPAYYIQNVTQVMMVTFPRLAAGFGADRAMSNIMGAYNDVVNGIRRTKDQELLDPDSDQFSAEESALLHRLLEHGLLDVGIAADLGSLQDAQSRVGQVMNRVHRGMVTGVRYIEVLNRATSALAAYRLQKAQLHTENPGMSDTEVAQAAQDYAYKSVVLTQGDYGGPNAPRVISKTPAGRLVFQFRKFQLIQIGILARSFHNAFAKKPPGMSEIEWKVTRGVARRHLGYIMGMHGMIGGLMGLPAANIIGYALAKAFGDEDEPDNFELMARRYIGDNATADLILKGFPAWAGVDASARLGMGLTFSWLPFTDVDLSRDGALVVLGSLLGPSAGVASKWFDGAGMIQDGNVLAGVARLTPKGVEDFYKMIAYSTDGIRTRQGDLALSADEMDAFDLVTQGLGWPSTTITDRYMAYGALQDVENHFAKRTSQIKRAFLEAHERGDSRGKRAAIAEWVRLQDRRREYGVGEPQPVSRLIRSISDRRERERNFVRGVQTSSTNRTFVESLFE